MTQRVVVYGESDDIVVADGEGLGEEFYPETDRFIVSFSEGTKLLVEYTEDATWKVSVMENGTASCSIAPVGLPENEDYSEYSEVATVVGTIEWVRGEDAPT